MGKKIQFPDGTFVSKSVPAGLDDLHRLAQDIRPIINITTTPKDLLVNKSFRKGVCLLCTSRYSIQDRITYLGVSDPVIRSLAAAALLNKKIHRKDRSSILLLLRRQDPQSLPLALMALENSWPAKGPGLAGEVMKEVGVYWDDPWFWAVLEDFFHRRMAAGDDILTCDWVGCFDEDDLSFIIKQLGHLGSDLARPLKTQIQSEVSSFQPNDLLDGFGHIHRPGQSRNWPPIAHHPEMSSLIDHVCNLLNGDLAQSILLLGESGVGKTAVATQICSTLAESGWYVLEATVTQLLSGQSLIGSLEKKIEALASHLSGHGKAIWFVLDFPQLVSAGRHSQSNVGALEMLLPHIKSGRILLVGESTSEALDKAKNLTPQFNDYFATFPIKPLGQTETLTLAKTWDKDQAAMPVGVQIGPELIEKAVDLVCHYGGSKALPGSVMGILSGAVRKAGARKAQGKHVRNIRSADLYASIENSIGIPPHILKPSRSVSRQSIISTLEKRVMGQTRTIGKVADCILRMHYGLSDNVRGPHGVFMLAGGSGTGKTELAKAVTGLLTGDPSSIIRLDMSEFSSPGSELALIGSTGPDSQNNLVAKIRRRPFSVVLLDEFEKAHPSIHNLFLQVFGEGRLSDDKGQTGCFRNALIFLTSNIGANRCSRQLVGFGAEATNPSSSVSAAVTAAFPLELRNRLTDVLVFDPLDHRAMSMILDKKIAEAELRPGLKGRQLNISLDCSARDFLIHTGFSEIYGARPLNRAIDQHVITPIGSLIARRRSLKPGSTIYVTAFGDGIRVSQYKTKDKESEAA